MEIKTKKEYEKNAIMTITLSDSEMSKFGRELGYPVENRFHISTDLGGGNPAVRTIDFNSKNYLAYKVCATELDVEYTLLGRVVDGVTIDIDAKTSYYYEVNQTSDKRASLFKFIRQIMREGFLSFNSTTPVEI